MLTSTLNSSSLFFCAWNLRLYRQTYHGLADIVAPLHRARLASVISIEPPHPTRAWLAETCPASVLKRLDLYRPYKGRTPAARRMRRDIIGALIERGRLLAPARAHRERLIDDQGGDALDSVIACLAAAATLRQLGRADRRDRSDRGKGLLRALTGRRYSRISTSASPGTVKESSPPAPAKSTS